MGDPKVKEAVDIVAHHCIARQMAWADPGYVRSAVHLPEPAVLMVEERMREIVHSVNPPSEQVYAAEELLEGLNMYDEESPEKQPDNPLVGALEETIGLTPEARATALHHARTVLQTKMPKGPMTSSGEVPPDVDDLLRVARWIVYGDGS